MPAKAPLIGALDWPRVDHQRRLQPLELARATGQRTPADQCVGAACAGTTCRQEGSC